MQIGLFTPVFNAFDLTGLLDAVKRYPSITMLEIGTGGWPGANHISMKDLLSDAGKIREYKLQLRDAGLEISAFSCHGNAVHPLREVADHDDALLRDTVRLAAAFEVSIVVTFSGGPGGGPQDKTPNWIIAAWPPEYLEAARWQWEERLIPYWRGATDFAATHGVKIALEAHPGFCVYNTETLLRLRSATSTSLGINLDPSHLWWQGMDIPTVVAALGESIFHVHAKDVAISSAKLAQNGLLDQKSYAEMAERSWLFRTVGWGHDELEWKRFISALRLAGYDYVLSIEHEDALASIDEGLRCAVRMLERIVLRGKAVEPWW